MEKLSLFWLCVIAAVSCYLGYLLTGNYIYSVVMVVMLIGCVLSIIFRRKK